jgi:hypothetical protein
MIPPHRLRGENLSPLTQLRELNPNPDDYPRPGGCQSPRKTKARQYALISAQIRLVRGPAVAAYGVRGGFPRPGRARSGWNPAREQELA